MLRERESTDSFYGLWGVQVDPYTTPHTLTTNFRYRRLGDLNRGPATLCACAGGEQQTIIKIVIHFL